MFFVRNLVVLLLLTSPMYWFFGVDVLEFSILKYTVLLFLFVFSLYITYKNKIEFDIYIIVLVLGMIVCICISELLNGVTDYFFNGIYPLIYYIVLMILFNSVFSLFNNSEIYAIVKGVNFSFFLLSIIILLDYFLELKISAPGVKETISTTGFTFLRTGWSGSISLFVGLTIYFTTSLGKRLSKFEVLFLFTVIYVQYISGGRGGALSSLLLLSYYFLFIDHGKNRLIFIASITIMLLYISSSELFITHLRLDRLDDAANGGITAGRITQYIEGLKYILDNSFMPSGTQGYLNYFHSIGIFYLIHNVPLNLLVQYGFLFIIIFILFIYYGACYRTQDKRLTVIVLLMLIPSLFEPAAIFINVNAYLVWWFVFYYHIYLKSINT